MNRMVLGDFSTVIHTPKVVAPFGFLGLIPSYPPHYDSFCYPIYWNYSLEV